VTCSDVRERFHYAVLLCVIMMLTMKEYAWSEERFWDLLLDCGVILLVEFLVDWTKHAFITRFNKIPLDVYQEYTVRLAYDLALTKQTKVPCTSSHFWLLHSFSVCTSLAFILLKSKTDPNQNVAWQIFQSYLISGSSSSLKS
jgi:hypothetical protein